MRTRPIGSIVGATAGLVFVLVNAGAVPASILWRIAAAVAFAAVIWFVVLRGPELIIPLAHVRGATVDPGITHEPKGWRGPGAHVPGVLIAVTFHHDGQRVFWDVHDSAKAIVIELDDDTYQRLVIEVPNPRATVEYIERAVAQH